MAQVVGLVLAELGEERVAEELGRVRALFRVALEAAEDEKGYIDPPPIGPGENLWQRRGQHRLHGQGKGRRKRC